MDMFHDDFVVLASKIMKKQLWILLTSAIQLPGAPPPGPPEQKIGAFFAYFSNKIVFAQQKLLFGQKVYCFSSK